MEDYLLSLCIFLPLLAALVAVLLEEVVWVGRLASGCAAILVLICLYLVVGFEVDARGPQFVERLSWIPELGAEYHLGVDGISLFPFALTGLLLCLALQVCRPARGEIAALLVAASGAFAAFAARDILLFCFCAEAVVLPLFVLVGRGDGHPRAGLRLMLSGLAGSAPMLVTVGYLAVAHMGQMGHLSFALADLQSLDLPIETESWLLLSFLLGFAVRAALVPFHFWLPTVQRTASPAVALIVFSAWLSVGAYGILRFCPTLFPAAFAEWRGLLAGLAVVAAVYGALLGLAQHRVRDWLVCATLSQVGWFVFGICTLHVAGLQGSVVLLLGHGLVMGAMLLLASMLAERGVESPSETGLGCAAPRLSGWLLVAVLATVGLPGTALFVGEFLILVAAFAIWGKLGLLILVAAVLHGVAGVRLVQRIVWGEGATDRAPAEMRWREAALVVPLLLVVFALGLRPGFVLDRVAGTVDEVLAATATVDELVGEE